EREAALKGLVFSQAQNGKFLSRQIRTGKAELAFLMLRTQRATLGAMVEVALKRQMYREAHHILQLLDQLWDAANLVEEAGTWVDRVLAACEGPTGQPPEMETPAGDLWLFVKGCEANLASNAYRLEDAERAYQELVTLWAGKTSQRAKSV